MLLDKIYSVHLGLAWRILGTDIETVWKWCFQHSHFSDFFIVYQISEAGFGRCVFIHAYVSARSHMDFLILFKSEKNLRVMVTCTLMYLNVSENGRTEIQFIVDNIFESPYLVLLEKVCLIWLRCFGIMLIILVR